MMLVVCIALLAATVATTAGSIALGAWVPLGERPAATAPPLPDPGQAGAPTYADFLDDIRAGRVIHVNQSGETLFVTKADGGYDVTLDNPDVDVVADMTGAANETGASLPTYSRDGGSEDLGERTYEELLADVALGRVVDVSQSGSQLSCSLFNGYYFVDLADPDVDVLGDIEAAAASGGVRPPAYSKYPAEGVFPIDE
jgi:hypothetical protein